MPGFDGTGPRGQGAMTGGARGYCAIPIGDVGRQSGVGMGGGTRGAGKGRRNCFYVTGLPGWMRAQREMPLGDDLESLKSQADLLKQQLEYTQARIQVMESRQGSDKK
jgi:hypothetical protein